MIVASKICKSYSRGREQVVAVKDVSFTIEAGERVALLGRSGSGKSTLLNLLAGLDQVTEGDLTVDQRSLSSADREQLDEYRKDSVGVVFQQFRLIKHRTAFQNAMLPLLVAGEKRRERRRRVDECMKLVGLEDRQHHRPNQLSGGEQQRVAVARAIANRPKLLLADEPTGNLDSVNAKQIMDLFLKVQQETQTTLLLITHDESLADTYTDRILRLEDGRLVDDSGSCSQVGENQPDTTHEGVS